MHSHLERLCPRQKNNEFACWDEHYRNTFIGLHRYKSLRGTSKVEALHLVLDMTVYASATNMRKLLFDAHLHWHNKLQP